MPDQPGVAGRDVHIIISSSIIIISACNFLQGLLDAAGLISAAPGRRNAALQQSAKQVENMVRVKMEQREYIILCLEDSNDWSNATSRRLVMQVHLLWLSDYPMPVSWLGLSERF